MDYIDLVTGLEIERVPFCGQAEVRCISMQPFIMHPDYEKYAGVLIDEPGQEVESVKVHTAYFSDGRPPKRIAIKKEFQDHLQVHLDILNQSLRGVEAENQKLAKRISIVEKMSFFERLKYSFFGKKYLKYDI